jgi:prepilin-type N-terminal cleavage/methylation domain-containing protein
MDNFFIKKPVNSSKSVNAFTLIELAVVLIVIGLVAGGVVAGQNMIKSAKMRSQITELQDYRKAVNTFIEIYGGIPGDISNGVDQWGAQTTNGDGDGQLESTTVWTGSRISPENPFYNGERPQFFRQLSLSKMIPELYDGSTVLGQGYPRVALNPNAGMYASGRLDTGNSVFDACPDMTTITSANLYMAILVAVPSQFNVSSNHNDDAGIFTTAEMLEIDRKTDDGKPCFGKVIAQSIRMPCTAALDYDLSSGNTKACNMLFELLE